MHPWSVKSPSRNRFEGGAWGEGREATGEGSGDGWEVWEVLFNRALSLVADRSFYAGEGS